MIGLRIGAAELAEMEAGAPAVVLAPGLLLPHAPPLLPLVLKQGVLVRPGADTNRSLPLPDWARPLALVAPEDLAEQMRPLLPAGLPVLPDAVALLGHLAGALRGAKAARDQAEAERARLLRAAGHLNAPLPGRVIELPPADGAGLAALPLTQPLGCPAEALCTVELHLAAASPAALIVRLLAGETMLGRWHVPAAALAPGWLALDLPEPAPQGSAEAVLEVSAEAGATQPPLSTTEDHPRASLALRAWTAGPGWAALPRYFDWAASGTHRSVQPLPLPASLLAGVQAEGARVELVGAGAEPPRLLLELPPGGAARLRLPPAPVGSTDLLRLRLARRDRADAPVAVAAAVECSGGQVASGWRELRGGDLPITLPLPPGPMASLTLELHHDATAPALVELSGIALQAGSAGEPRRAPAQDAAPASRAAIQLPDAMPLQPHSWRAGPPAPRLAVARPGGAQAPQAMLAPSIAGPPSPAAFQEVRVNQHLVNADGGYAHLDLNLDGLVSGGGLWRQLRLKLFERRGTAGLEFREIKGWPQMFDVWPSGGTDGFGSFWRLETEATAEALSALATPHDRAMIAALLDVLPGVASRAAAAVGMGGAEAEAWVARSRRLAEAVAQARDARSAV